MVAGPVSRRGCRLRRTRLHRPARARGFSLAATPGPQGKKPLPIRHRGLRKRPGAADGEPWSTHQTPYPCVFPDGDTRACGTVSASSLLHGIGYLSPENLERKQPTTAMPPEHGLPTAGACVTFATSPANNQAIASEQTRQPNPTTAGGNGSSPSPRPRCPSRRGATGGKRRGGRVRFRKAACRQTCAGFWPQGKPVSCNSLWKWAPCWSSGRLRRTRWADLREERRCRTKAPSWVPPLMLGRCLMVHDRTRAICSLRGAPELPSSTAKFHWGFLR